MSKKFLSIVSIYTAAMLFVSSPAQAHMGESHEVESGPIPTVSLTATKDEIGGFNIHIETSNFTWAPENASEAHVPGEGHAHIYVDGVKVGRVYSNWYHLATANLDLAAGIHTVEVNLNGNDHGAYTVNGEEVRASAEIEIAESTDTGMNSHDHMDSTDLTVIWISLAFVLGALIASGAFLVARKLQKK